MKRTLTVLFALVTLSLMANDSDSKTTVVRQISVTGSTSIDIPPDHVTIKVSIVTIDKSYEVAYSSNTEKVKKTLVALDTIGIPLKDISTNYVSLSKKEAERDNNTPVFMGYEASNDIVIILRDLSKYDTLLSSIIKMGVNKIESVTFGISNEQEKRKEAQLQAIQAAKEKAEYLAQALNQKVCAPIRISETQVSNPYNYSSVSYASAAPVVPSSLIPSNITIKASVDVTFFLCD
jgi:uncharacterized protein YggE